VLASANGNRKAERPANAILNYLYALLEAEAILACHALALDPGFGLVHLDARSRQSLTLDLMEPVRPQVDTYVLDLLAHRTFRKVEFHETSDGHVGLKVPFTHELAETIPMWSRALAPYAERVAHVLGQAMAGKYNASTPLTAARSKAAAAKVKARKLAAFGAATAKTTSSCQRPTGGPTRGTWSCPECGGRVSGPSGALRCLHRQGLESVAGAPSNPRRRHL
jgi:CRISPR associated protein Cas1